MKEVICQGPGYEVQKSAKGCALYQIDDAGGKWIVAEFAAKALALKYHKLEFQRDEEPEEIML